MRQVVRRLKRSQTSYVLFNVSVILILLMLAVVIITSFVIENNILNLNYDFSWNSLNTWLLIGTPMILLVFAAIIGSFNFLFFDRTYKSVQVKKYFLIKRNINIANAMVWIMIILVIGAMAVLTGGLFIHESDGLSSWDWLGFRAEVNADLYLQFYVFGSWVIAFIALVFGMITLSLLYYAKKWVVFKSEESTHDTKIVPLAEKEIKNIKGTIRTIEKEMTHVEKETKKLSNIFARLQNHEVPLGNKIIKDVEKMKIASYRELDYLKSKIWELETTLQDVGDPKVKRELKNLREKVQNQETKMGSIAETKKVAVQPVKKVPVKKVNVTKTVISKPQVKPVAVAKTQNVITKPKKVKPKPKPVKILSQKDLVKKIHHKINNDLTLGDIYKFNESVIRRFVNEFSGYIYNKLAKKEKVVINNFVSMKHYVGKPTTRVNPQNPSEIIDIPSKNKIKVVFAENFRETIAPDIKRDPIKWDKKMTINLSSDDAWKKVSNNIEKLLLLSKDELIKLADYANVKIKTDDKKEDIVNALKYIDAKHANAMPVDAKKTKPTKKVAPAKKETSAKKAPQTKKTVAAKKEAK